MQFDDNLLLPRLFGERDQYRGRIERRLGVSLVSRGNRLAIGGPAPVAEIAKAAIAALYDRLKRGLEVDAAEVDAAVRLAEERADPKTVPLLREDATIRTRKRHIS